MNVTPIRRSTALLGGAMLASALVLVPAAAQAIAPASLPATPEVAEDAPAACTVTGGTLSWGVKESFRSYISGSIANGSWEATEGATYETPAFTWSGGTGSIDPETGTGTVSFVGTTHFTGHDGVLDLTFANPTLEFEGDGTATLLLDARSTDATGAVTIDTAQEWVGDVEAPATLPVTGTALDVEDMATSLTNSGAKAFAGFYEAGDELDPISIALMFENCDVSAAPVASEEETPAPEVAETTEAPAAQQVPWLPIIIGGVAILVIGVTAGMLVAGRKRPARPGAADPAAPVTQDTPPTPPQA